MWRRYATAILSFVAVGVSIAYLAHLSWARWADPLVDFGQQLYLPWQVSQGKLLYGDLAYYNGPLSVWANAAAFRLFGTGMWTLIGCNALVAIVILSLLYWMFRSTSSAWGATLAALVFVWLFAFGKYMENSNYNYLCPYNHEMTHGLCLALAMIAILWQGPLEHFYVAPSAGIMLGLVLLTKAEMSFAALAAALALWLMWRAWLPKARRRELAARMALFGACAALPALGTFSYLASCLPIEQALTGTVGSWAVAATSDVRHLYFYRVGLGMINLEKNLISITLGCLVYVLFLIVNAASAYALAAASARQRYAATAIICAGFVAGLAQYSPIIDVFQPLPLVLLGLLVWLTIVWRQAPNVTARLIAERRLSLVVFAGVLLVKMAFATRIVHYGFVLAMPAVLVACAAFTSWIPAALSSRGLYGGCLAGSSSALVFFCIAIGQAVHHTYYWRPATQIGYGPDYFVSESPKAEAVARVAAVLASSTRPEERVLVFPEGVMLNYLSRRESPTKFTNFMPPEALFFGEDRMLAALEARPPEWIVIAPKDLLVDYNVRLGQGFLDEIVKWIHEHYDEEMKCQSPNGYYMLLLKHRAGLEPRTAGTTNGTSWQWSDAMPRVPAPTE